MNLKHSYTRRSFLKQLALGAAVAPFVTRGLMAQSPNGILRHASFGAAGMAGSDIGDLTSHKSLRLVAVAEVDLNRAAEVRKRFPDAKIYQDWRELLDKEAKNLDSVNVSTPDHMHAPITMSALQLGKHVYCQKPLAHDLHEVRRVTELAREKKLITQMGIQIHAHSAYRMAVQLLQRGVIGTVKEVHSWCPKSWGDTGTLPSRTDPVPASLDWNLWLGVCAERPFIGEGYYHPSNWRKRLDFGTGTFGDMGCHIFDPVFNALGLGAPISVRSEGPAPNQSNWALDSKIHYTFRGTKYTAEKTLPVTWYDGAAKPPAEVLALLEGDAPPGSGSIFVGTKGVLVLPHWARPLLYPDATFKDFQFPKVESLNHYGQFVDACLGQGRTEANFDYAGPLTEAVLLGGVASHFPQTTIEFNPEKMQFTLPEAQKLLRRTYRKGWEVKGLS